MRDGVDFERKIYVKQQTAWLLRQELKKVKRGEQIAIGTATDPYQPAEKSLRVTRGISGRAGTTITAWRSASSASRT